MCTGWCGPAGAGLCLRSSFRGFSVLAWCLPFAAWRRIDLGECALVFCGWMGTLCHCGGLWGLLYGRSFVLVGLHCLVCAEIFVCLRGVFLCRLGSGVFFWLQGLLLVEVLAYTHLTF